MTRYREFIPRELPLRGLAADPRAKEVQPGEWATHDQFHIVNRRIWKYPGWQKWNPEVEYYYYYYYGSVIGEALLDRYVLHLPDDSTASIEMDRGLAPIIPPTPFTLEFWMRAYNPGFGTTQINPAFGMWHLGMRAQNSGGQPGNAFWRALTRKPPAAADWITVFSSVPPGDLWGWHHYALTFDGRYCISWVDGNLTAITDMGSTGHIVEESPMWPAVIGGDYQFVNSHQGVDMYDFHWSDTVRYTVAFTPAVEAVADGNTIILWKFDNNLNDSSINLRHGVPNAGVGPATSFVLK